jgi:hypothetical protein
MPHLSVEPRACTLCSQPLLEQAAIETRCPTCDASLTGCVRCVRPLGDLVRVSLAARHGCPGGRCSAASHWFRGGSNVGDACACGVYQLNESERGMVRRGGQA